MSQDSLSLSLAPGQGYRRNMQPVDKWNSVLLAMPAVAARPVLASLLFLVSFRLKIVGNKESVETEIFCFVPTARCRGLSPDCRLQTLALIFCTSLWLIYSFCTRRTYYVKKSKAIPVTGRGGL
jgi:hypothetical protein